jgi:hypothetical protein
MWFSLLKYLASGWRGKDGPIRASGGVEGGGRSGPWPLLYSRQRLEINYRGAPGEGWFAGSPGPASLNQAFEQTGRQAPGSPGGRQQGKFGDGAIPEIESYPDKQEVRHPGSQRRV